MGKQPNNELENAPKQLVSPIAGVWPRAHSALARRAGHKIVDGSGTATEHSRTEKRGRDVTGTERKRPSRDDRPKRYSSLIRDELCRYALEDMAKSRFSVHVFDLLLDANTNPSFGTA